MNFFAESLPRDWFDWTNAGVGVAGFLFTLGAIWQATGAKKAAQSAANNIKKHTAEIDFDTLTRIAKELHGYVESGKMPEARLRTTDLRTEMAVAISHHESFLGESAKVLKSKQVDLKLVADGLNRKADDLSQTERIRLLGITGAILELLAGQCGQLRSATETGVTNG